jgi:hypothetical protein
MDQHLPRADMGAELFNMLGHAGMRVELKVKKAA